MTIEPTPTAVPSEPIRDLYTIWLIGLEAEAEMEIEAGYPAGWQLLDQGLAPEAIERFKAADEYAQQRGWRLPIQIKWVSEVQRIRMLMKLRMP